MGSASNDRRGARGTIGTLALGFAFLCLIPASASAADCSYDPASGVLSVGPAGGVPPDQVGLSRAADLSIQVELTELREDPFQPVEQRTCFVGADPRPDVTNVDRVVINSYGDVEIDLTNGPLAPGRTVEADGSSEIELEVGLTQPTPRELTIVGGPTSDRFTFGERDDVVQADISPGADAEN
jgi:hypothetical protein